MDIRSFFGKKPAAKKKPPAGGSSSVSASSSSSNVDNDSKTSKKNAQKEAVTRKRKATEKKEEEEAVEISPQEFFAMSNSKNKPKNRTSKNKSVAKETVPIAKKVRTEKNPSPSPAKKIRSPSPPKSSVRRSTRRTSRSVEKEEEIAAEKGKKNKRRMILDDDDDDDDNDEDEDGDFVMKVNESESDKNSDDDEFEPKPKESKRKNSRNSKISKPKSPLPPSPVVKRSRAPILSAASSKKKSPASATTKKPEIALCKPNPDMERDSFDVDDIKVSECMIGPTFVFTGVMDNLNRDDAIDLVKTLGGRVTTAVSGKTNYLVVGPVLEDGRDYKEGSKYKKATGFGDEKVKLVMGEKQLYGLCHFYHDKAMKEKGIDPNKAKETNASASIKIEAEPTSAASLSNPYVKKATGAPVSNPYAKKGPVSNPYAKKGPVNPYAKKGTANPYAKSTPVPSSTVAVVPTPSNVSDNPNMLWVDRHKPTSTREILGNQGNVKKLQSWLKSWERTFNDAKAVNKTFNNPRGPLKAALLSGPPGIGKTTTATLVAKEDGRDVLEYNASDARSKKALQFMGDLTGSQGISFANAKKKSSSKKKPSIQKRCIIMDEVDGMGGGDRSGISELIQMIKKSRTPIICICNDRQSQKIKSLLPYCMDLRYSRPTKNSLANRAIRIAEMEGLTVERNAAEAIAMSCGNDVRQVLNLLQMWAQKKNIDGEGDNALTYKKLKDRGKSIQKDEMLRVSLFDAAKLIVEGPKDLQSADDKTKLNSLFKRTDAFFVDYSFTGLIVQQNYPKVTNSQYQRIKGDDEAEIELMQRFSKAADSMSDYDLVERQIRGGDLNWSLLPTTAMLAVKTGYHAGGENGGFLGGFPEFTTWMGKNSSMGKNYRLLNELSHHMNYNISANAQELRQSYIPVMRDRILKLLKNADSESNKEAIDLMDDYGLSRDDVADKLDVLVLGKKDFSFDDLDSKAKAAFTRQYNSGVHKSQALVREQGGGGAASKKKRKKEIVDDDEELVDDSDDDSENEIDEEKELAKLQAQFKKKGRKKAAPKKKSK